MRLNEGQLIWTGGCLVIFHDQQLVNATVTKDIICFCKQKYILTGFVTDGELSSLFTRDSKWTISVVQLVSDASWILETSTAWKTQFHNTFSTIKLKFVETLWSYQCKFNTDATVGTSLCKSLCSAH